MLPLKELSKVPGEEAILFLRELLCRIGDRERADVEPMEGSGGMQRRVGQRERTLDDARADHRGFG